MKTVLITGGTGSIGNALVPMLLKKNYRVIIFTRRNKRSDNPNCTYATWDPDEFSYDKNAIEEADFIINLAGAGIADKRWTDKRKDLVYDSRINSDITIVKAISEVPNKIRAVVNASAIGFYGADKGKLPFVENDPPGEGFLSKVCNDWERMITNVTELQKRLVILRTGVVLDKTGGAYKEFSNPLRFRLAAVLGNGKQIISWIHIHDMCLAYIEAIENENMSGIYNTCAPNPVSNEDLVTSIAKEKYGNAFLKMKVPAFILKIALGQLAKEALLESATVSCDKLLQSGFQFQFHTIEDAVKDLESQK